MPPTASIDADAPATPDAQRVRFGEREWAFPSADLAPLHASDPSDTPEALRARLAADGYLYLPGLIARDAVLSARAAILRYMDQHEGLEPGSRPLEGVMGASGKSVPMTGTREITHHPDVLAVLESPRLFAMHAALQGEPVQSFDYKWLRAVGVEEFTGAHMDHVYMGRGSKRVLTTWVPLDDLPLERGVLAVCRGSHNLESFARLRETYGRMDVDRDRAQGWFTNDPGEITEAFGGQWQTTAFGAGDVLIFGMHLMHASTTNTRDRWRLSCDVRFQPSADASDPRWVGERPIGHIDHGDTTIPMEEMRAAWGV